MFIHNSWASSLALATSYKSLQICAFCRLCFQVKNEQRCTLLKVLSFGSSSFFSCPLGSPKTEAAVLQLCRIPAYHAVSSVNLSPRCFSPKSTGHKKTPHEAIGGSWGRRGSTAGIGTMKSDSSIPAICLCLQDSVEPDLLRTLPTWCWSDPLLTSIHGSGWGDVQKALFQPLPITRAKATSTFLGIGYSSVSTSWYHLLSWWSQAAITIYHILGGLNNTHLFLTAWETRKSNIKGQQIWLLVRALFLAGRRPPSLYVPTR